MNRRILVIEDDSILNRLLCDGLNRAGHDAKGARRWAEAQRRLAEESVDLVLLDVSLPDADGLDILPKLAERQPVIILTAYGSVQNAVAAMKRGAAEYLEKPINLDELEVAVARVLEMATLRRDHQYIRSRVEALTPHDLVGSGAAMIELRARIAALAATDAPALIRGECGTGKTLAGNLIHAQSARAKRNFVIHDGGTHPGQDFQATLFGTETDLKTQAGPSRTGLILDAEDGTLFLDAVAEIDAAAQDALLQFLVKGIYRRIGAGHDRTAQARVIAATSRDLESMARAGAFRPALLEKLGGQTIHLPPLRERKDDIPELVAYFLSHIQISHPVGKRLTPPALDRLLAYDWPGNIRELRNIVERAMILSGDGADIAPEHLGL
jgi:DNA-binding NtrC family response regulator